MHRKPTLLAGATLAALAIAGPAAAHTPSVSVACEIPADGGPGVPAATYTYRDFGASPVTATETTTAAGVATTGTYTFTRNGQHVVTLAPRYGRFVLSGASSSVQDGRTWRASATAEVDCGTEPAPPPFSPPVTPPEQPATPQALPAPRPAEPPVVTPGVPEPMPRKRATPKPKPRKVTCAWLNAHRAGPKAYTARGWYFRCRTPRAHIVYRVPVTG